MARDRSRSPAGGGADTTEILRIIFEREQARFTKDYSSGDQLRERLTSLGVSLFDKTNSWKSSDGRTGRIPSFADIEGGQTAEEFIQRQMAGALGVMPNLSDGFDDSTEEGQIKRLVQLREQARANKDFNQSDKLRDELKALGVELFDKDKLWRAKDGKSGCILGYSRDGGCTDMEISTLVLQREKARHQSDFNTADMIRGELKKCGVDIDDKGKVWRATDGRQGAVPPWAAFDPKSPPVQELLPLPPPSRAQSAVRAAPVAYIPAGRGAVASATVSRSEASLRDQVIHAANLAARNPASAASSLQQLAKFAQSMPGSAPPPPPQVFQAAAPPPAPRSAPRAPPSPEFQDAMGLLQECQATGRPVSTEEIAWCVEVREKARMSKDFHSSDELRNMLRNAVGVELFEKEKRWEAKDGRQGSIPLWSSISGA